MADVKKINGYDVKDASARSDIASLDTRVTALENGGTGITSHIGMIIMSTTLDTMAKVVSEYGGTTWIRHENYFLLGVPTGSTVTPNSALKDGGEETHQLTVAEMPSHTHTQNSHNHTQNAHTHVQNEHTHQFSFYKPGAANNGSGNVYTPVYEQAGLGNYSTTGATATNQNATATNNATTATNQNTGGDGAHNNMPPYKYVYIWERTA